MWHLARCHNSDKTRFASFIRWLAVAKSDHASISYLARCHNSDKTRFASFIRWLAVAKSDHASISYLARCHNKKRTINRGKIYRLFVCAVVSTTPLRIKNEGREDSNKWKTLYNDYYTDYLCTNCVQKI